MLLVVYFNGVAHHGKTLRSSIECTMQKTAYTRFIVESGRIVPWSIETLNGTKTILSQSEPAMHVERRTSVSFEVHAHWKTRLPVWKI